MNIFNFKAISTKHLFTNKKIAVVSVINDLVTDVRVSKTCSALLESGYAIVLIGRQLNDSKPLPDWPYQAVRMKMVFQKGPLFYLFFNLRLFFQLLFRKANVLYANDLDTLWPNYLISKLKGIPLIYDAHELFCEVPELINRPFKRNIWLYLEKRIVPKLRWAITVSDGIAHLYKEKYNTHFEVVRNIPPSLIDSIETKSRKELGMPENKKIMLLQGAGINVDRGAEELIDAMAFVNNAVLYIIGSGDVWNTLLKKVKEQHLEDKIILINKIPKQDLVQYTLNADIGLSIDKNTNLNYYYSLPNKLFDYIDAGLPVLATRLNEIEKIINSFQIGEFIDNHQPAHMAQRINQFLQSEHLKTYKTNMQKAKQILNWQVEKQKLLRIIAEADVNVK